MSRNFVHAQLTLQQLADSAFPIGGQAHSFGLETLVSDGVVTPQNLASFLEEYLIECATVDAWICRQAYQLADVVDNEQFIERWLLLSQQVSALRSARESRAASAALGRRFLGLLQSLSAHPRLVVAYQASRTSGTDLHYSATYGLVGGTLDLGEEETILSLLQQGLGALLAASQKMMSVGQSQTVGILWQMKPMILAASERSRSWSWDNGFSSFGLMLDIASMRHATLPVRLFIS